MGIIGKKSGLINVADELREKEVSMEQIYQWNPDIVYIFMGEPATNYINGIEGQNWTMVKDFSSRLEKAWLLIYNWLERKKRIMGIFLNLIEVFIRNW